MPTAIEVFNLTTRLKNPCKVHITENSEWLERGVRLEDLRSYYEVVIARQGGSGLSDGAAGYPANFLHRAFYRRNIHIPYSRNSLNAFPGLTQFDAQSVHVCSGHHGSATWPLGWPQRLPRPLIRPSPTQTPSGQPSARGIDILRGRPKENVHVKSYA